MCARGTNAPRPASAGRLLAETNQPGKQPRVDQTRTTAREGSEDGSSAGALTRTSIGKSWDLATCGCIIFGAPLSCMPTNKEEEGKEERERERRGKFLIPPRAELL